MSGCGGIFKQARELPPLFCRIGPLDMSVLLQAFGSLDVDHVYLDSEYTA